MVGDVLDKKSTLGLGVEEQKARFDEALASGESGTDEKQLPQNHILLVSSVPLAAPWNGGDKNMARLLVLHDEINRFTVNTSQSEQWPEPRVRAVRSNHASPMPTRRQKIDDLKYLLRYTPSVDLIHIITSLSSPTRLIGRALGGWSRMTGKKTIHTIPSLGGLPLEDHHFFADATVVLSEHSRQRLLAHDVRNVWRVFPPLDASLVKPTVDPFETRRQLDLGPRAVLYPTHFGVKNGILSIIEAFSRLPDSVADSVLVLACRRHPWQDQEQEERKIHEMARAFGVENRVRIVGNVADMYSLISACAITVLVPSHLGSKMDLPLVVLESLMLQRPVILSDISPMNEAAFGAGLAIKPNDVAGFSEALLRLLGDQHLRDTLGRQGKVEVARHCAPDRVAEQYQSIYSSLTRKVSNPA